MPGTVPTLVRVPWSETDKIIATIERDGGVIATDFTDLATLRKVDAEVQPYLDADKPWRGKLFPPETRRCSRLISRSPTARESWLTRPALSTVLNHFLCHTSYNWFEDTLHEHISYPQVAITCTLDIRPGAKGQRLHRDDKNWHPTHTDRTKIGYTRGDDVEMAVLVPSVECTQENGATVVIPGSHLWDDRTPPARSLCTYATMPPGSALLFLGSTYHAGGTNSTLDQNRPMHSMFFCRGTLRQEENQYLSHELEDVRSNWSTRARELAGYGVSQPMLGFVDFRSPIGKGGLLSDEDQDFVGDIDEVMG